VTSLSKALFVFTMSETLTPQIIPVLPAWSPSLDVERFNVRQLAFELARITRKSAFDVLKDAGYPVFRFATTEAAQGAEPEAELVSKAAGATSNSSRLIQLIASTNAQDMVGDVMDKTSLEEMRSAAVGTTVFLNHQYLVPDDVFGTVVSAEVVDRTLPHPLTKQPTKYTCLVYKVDPVTKEENKRGFRTAMMILNGRRRLGASVTVLILDKLVEGDKRRIKHVYYIETSIVGVPCNPLSWVEHASKALNQAVEKMTDTLERLSTVPVGQIVAKAAPTELTAAEQPNNTESNVMSNPNANAKVGRKGAFEDQFKQRTGSIYFLTDLLTSAFYELRRKARQPNSSIKVKDEVTLALNEFSAAVIEKVVPMMEAASTEVAYYSFFNPGDGAKFALDLLQKSVLLGDDADAGDNPELVSKSKGNDTDNSKIVQQMHDHCCAMGAKCMASAKAAPVVATGSVAALGSVAEASSESGGAELKQAAATLEAKVASLTADIAQKDGALASKDAELAELRNQLKQAQADATKWKACSWTALAELNSDLSEPLPRVGDSV
jgi:hypothetical protein